MMAIKCYICGTDHKDMEEVMLHHPDIPAEKHILSESETF